MESTDEANHLNQLIVSVCSGLVLILSLYECQDFAALFVAAQHARRTLKSHRLKGSAGLPVAGLCLPPVTLGCLPTQAKVPRLRSSALTCSLSSGILISGRVMGHDSPRKAGHNLHPERLCH